MADHNRDLVRNVKLSKSQTLKYKENKMANPLIVTIKSKCMDPENSELGKEGTEIVTWASQNCPVCARRKSKSNAAYSTGWN